MSTICWYFEFPFCGIIQQQKIAPKMIIITTTKTGAATLLSKCIEIIFQKWSLFPLPSCIKEKGIVSRISAILSIRSQNVGAHFFRANNWGLIALFQNHCHSAFAPRPRPNQNHLSLSRKLYLKKVTNITFTFSATLHKLTYLLWQFAFSVKEARH